MFKTLIFVHISLALSTCLSQYLNRSSNFSNIDILVPRISNGRPANLGQVPYQIAFKAPYSRKKGLYMTFCGGVIIAPTKVLSAAHCFEEKGSKCTKFWSSSITGNKKLVSRTFAVAGNLYNIAPYNYADSTEHGQWRQLAEVIYPRLYRFPKHDISIAHTLTPFVYNSYVSAIPISSRFADYSGRCLVSGYGRISESELSERLLLGELSLLTAFQCTMRHFKNMRHFICTLDQVTDVQKGDSGGPLVCKGTGDPNEGNKGVLVGIVSGHRYGAGSFFTRVSSYYHYIQSKVDMKSINQRLLLSVYFVLYLEWLLFLFCFIFEVIPCLVAFSDSQ